MWKHGAHAAECIARENARELVRRLLGRSSRRLRNFSPGIAGVLEHWLEYTHADIACCWHEAFSKVLVALRSNEEKAVIEANIALAMHLNGCGELGNWTADVEEQMQCLWGNWLLPKFDRVAVHSNGAEAVLTLNCGGRATRIRFIRSGSEWLRTESDLGLLAQVGLQNQKIILLPRAVAQGVRPNAFPAVVEDVSPEIATRWQDAIIFIRDCAPEYRFWVADAIRQIAVLESTPGTVHSGSYEGKYGFMYGSALASIPSSAEMLIHEASHQYFHMLSRLGPVDDGTDLALYHSPLVGRGRPLNRILFAFHACANILAYYRLCRAAGAPNEAYFAKNERLVIAQLEQLSSPLRANPALTSLGRALFEPWAEKIT